MNEVESVEEETRAELFSNLSQRRQYTYKARDVFYSIFWRCKCNKVKEKIFASLQRQNENFSKGMDMFDSDLDWVKLVNSIKDLQFLAKVILDRKQISLLKFTNDSLLNSQKFDLSLISRSGMVIPTVSAEESEVERFRHQLSRTINSINLHDPINKKIFNLVT